MKDILKALQLGLPEALIISLGLVSLYILVPLFANGGSLLLVEPSQPILILEIVVATGIVGYGIYRVNRLIRGKHND